jgi:hypothetical protein
MPPDRFYNNYSFSLHFGYGPEDEYNKIKTIISGSGIDPNNENVRLSMELVRSVAIEAKRLGFKEIRKIDDRTKEEKTVGGIAPTDITIAYEILRQFLELATYGIEVGTFSYLVYKNIKKKFSKSRKKYTTNTIQNEMLKIIKKITEDNKSSKIISQQYQNFVLRMGGRKIISTHKKKGFTIKGTSKNEKKSDKRPKK